MEQLLRIFFRNGSFFTFVALELLCLYLIINFNSTQNAIAMETWSVRTGRVKSFFTRVNSYFDLREEIDVNLRENARLRGLLPESQYSTRAERDSIVDPEYLQRFNYLATRVVNRSPYKPNNTFIIDRGGQFGVLAGQGVIDNQGLLGIIDQTTDNHARAVSILHQSTRISAGLKSGAFGTLRWDGLDPRRMTLVDLPDFITVGLGDTVFTTGFSNIFPTSQVIGTVESSEVQAGTGNQHLQVRLINTPLTAASAYVVQDLFKEELGILNEDN